jgi:hypothetical protein
MSHTNRQPWRNLRSHGFRAGDLDRLLNALRALDRTVVEISMHIYKVPPRDRTAMRKQHRRLHDTIRECLPRFLS